MYPYSRSARHQRLLLGVLIWVSKFLCTYADVAAVSSAYATRADSAICPYRTPQHIPQILPQTCLNSPRPIGSNGNRNLTNGSSGPSPKTQASSTTAVITSTKPIAEEISSTTSVSAALPTLSTAESEGETDSESPLGKDNFLSFEEWKRRNLDRYGQSPDRVWKSKHYDHPEARRQPIDVLDALGDDPEIDLDFSAFASERPQIALPSHADGRSPDLEASKRGKEAPRARPRSEDAGRTFKERFNYASFDCAATVLKTNPKSSGSSAVLVENKDSYMLNECSVMDKFLILELCEDILIDTIVLANFEFFSSIFRSFTVSVSDRYPVKMEKWMTLGTFEARNTREVQAFLVENPMIWTKYVRIEFRTHYGNEFYCPLSLVRVHGTTMLEDYRHDEDHSKAEENYEAHDQTSEVGQQREPIVFEAIVGVPVEEEGFKDEVQTGNTSTVQSSIQGKNRNQTKVAENPSSPRSHSSDGPVSQNFGTSNLNATLWPPWLLRQQCQADEAGSSLGKTNYDDNKSEGVPNVPTSSQNRCTVSLKQGAALSRTPVSLSSPRPIERKSTLETPTVSSRTQSIDRSTSIQPSKTEDFDGSGPPVSATQPPPSNPTIQESFFKSVQKRLQMLESNSTLSLQYIEEQSRILRDAFSKVEQRQLSKTTKFLDYLNGTVLRELREFRQQYDLLWQSTVFELGAQREQSQHEAVAMGARLSILADEIVFQKRMAVLQSVLVLFCIILALFSRGAINSYLEHPLVQNVLARSATFKPRAPFLDTPSLSPESSRPSSSYKTQARGAYEALVGHQRNLSAKSQNGAEHSSAAYSPPTPMSYDGQADFGDGERDDASGQGLSPASGDAHDYMEVRPSTKAVDSDNLGTPVKSGGENTTHDPLSMSPVSSTRSSNESSGHLPNEEISIGPSSTYLQVPHG